MMYRTDYEHQERHLNTLFYSLKLFRHTKVNPNRKVIWARPGFTWRRSHENYQYRLKNRWPVRYFLAYELKPMFWYPVLRFCRSLLKPTELHPNVIELLETVDGVLPRKVDSLSMKRILDARYGPELSNKAMTALRFAADLPAIEKSIRKDEMAIKPRMGMNNVDIFSYPEYEDILERREVFSALIDQCGIVAKLLKDSNNSVDTN